MSVVIVIVIVVWVGGYRAVDVVCIECAQRRTKVILEVVVVHGYDVLLGIVGTGIDDDRVVMTVWYAPLYVICIVLAMASCLVLVEVVLLGVFGG